MQKIFAIIIIAICFTNVLDLSGQTTIDEKSNHPKPNTIQNYKGLDITTVDIPSVGENQSWNFGGVQFSTSVRNDTMIAPPVYKGFPDATVARAFNERFLGLVPQKGHDLFKLDNSGYSNLGRHFNRTVANLSATDSLVIPDQDVTYKPASIATLQFPLSLNATWSGKKTFTSEAILNYAMLFLKDGKISYNTITETDNKVVGWGKLTLKDKVLDVLLVETLEILTDSVYLNGKPAPPQLLAVGGLENGQQSKYTVYRFYSPLIAGSVLSIFSKYKGDSITSATVNNSALTSIEESVLDSKLVDIFPNPVNNTVLTIQLREMKEAKMELISYSGQVIGSYQLQEGKNQIGLADNITNGLYLYRITNSKNGEFLTNQILINR